MAGLDGKEYVDATVRSDCIGVGDATRDADARFDIVMALTLACVLGPTWIVALDELKVLP